MRNSGISVHLFVSIFTLAALTFSEVSAQEHTADIVSDGVRTVFVYDFNGILPFLSSESDTIHVVNFWATWCAPCVEELPYFEALTKENRDRPLKVLLVSLDFRQQLESRLLPFLLKHNIQSQVLVLDDPDANSWIEKVDPGWSGAIPATLVFRRDKRIFREQAFTQDELFTLVTSFEE